MGIRKLTETNQWKEHEKHVEQQGKLKCYPGFAQQRFHKLQHQLTKDTSLQGTEQVTVYLFKNLFPYNTALSIKGIERLKKQGYNVEFAGSFSLSTNGLISLLARYDKPSNIAELL